MFPVSLRDFSETMIKNPQTYFTYTPRKIMIASFLKANN